MVKKIYAVLIFTSALLIAFSSVALAAEKLSAEQIQLDTIWTMLTAFLIFFMQAGFALLESGLTRFSNTVSNVCNRFEVKQFL